ncbi:MFS transporter [Metapseudomonas otitidis]|uniref:MFS transporter n=1 Tax=Metapseudomonas otitidis TaxID=319939 RepID=UPI003A84672C
MDALLILGGLLSILFSLVWLVMLAFGTSLLWGFGSLLLPPITLAYIAAHWRTARKAVMLLALGIIPLVVGLTMLAYRDPERLHALLSLDWAKPEKQAPGELAIHLRGELNGEPFLPQQAELIDGVLSLREGQDFFARREVSIRLPSQPEGDVRLDILPEDPGSKPEVEISWLLPEQELPEARRLSKGYTLHLDLKRTGPNKLAGGFHLVLPPQLRTTLSGDLELFTDRLRYANGQVDLRHDSQDTLAYVARDYLQRRFATREVQVTHLPPVSLPARDLDLDVEARIDGVAQRLPLQFFKSDLRGWGIRGDAFPPLPAVEAKPATAEAEPEEARPSRPVDRRQRFSLERLLTNPNRYQNLTVRVQTVRGSQVEGRFTGINPDGQVVIQRNVSGAGSASFVLRPEEIARIELLEP